MSTMLSEITEESIGFPGTSITGSWKKPKVGAGYQTPQPSLYRDHLSNSAL